MALHSSHHHKADLTIDRVRGAAVLAVFAPTGGPVKHGRTVATGGCSSALVNSPRRPGWVRAHGEGRDKLAPLVLYPEIGFVIWQGRPCRDQGTNAGAGAQEL